MTDDAMLYDYFLRHQQIVSLDPHQLYENLTTIIVQIKPPIP